MEIDSSKKVNSRNRFRYICSVEKPLKNSGFGKIPLCYQKKKEYLTELYLRPKNYLCDMYFLFEVNDLSKLQKIKKLLLD